MVVYNFPDPQKCTSYTNCPEIGVNNDAYHLSFDKISHCVEIRNWGKNILSKGRKLIVLVLGEFSETRTPFWNDGGLGKFLRN